MLHQCAGQHWRCHAQGEQCLEDKLGEGAAQPQIWDPEQTFGCMILLTFTCQMWANGWVCPAVWMSLL